MKFKLAFVIAFCSAMAAFAQFYRVDPSFAVEIDGWVYAIAVQPNGKILIGGKFSNVGGLSRPYFAVLNENGSVDSSFVLTGAPLYGGETPYARVDRIESIGQKIYLTAYNSFGVRRYDSNGSLERTYPTSSAFAVDSLGRVIRGRQTEYLRFDRVNRYNEDGTQDLTFNVKIGCCFNEGANAVALQNHAGFEKILIAGRFDSIGDSNRVINLARLNEDGSFDTTFHVFGYYPEASQIKVSPDGRFFVAGDNLLAKHLPDGSLDPSFEPSYGDAGDFIAGIVVESDGSVVVAGKSYPSDPLLRRFHADGTRDTNFLIALNNDAHAVAVDGANRVLIGGEFTSVDCIRRTYLARLIPNDVPDPLPCVSQPPEPAPELEVLRLRGAKMACCWPTNYPEYSLQATRRFHPKHPEKEKWITVTNAPVVNEGSVCITNRIARWGRHYRLVQQ